MKNQTNGEKTQQKRAVTGVAPSGCHGGFAKQNRRSLFCCVSKDIRLKAIDWFDSFK